MTKIYQRNFWSGRFCALDHASFSVEQNQVVGFLGANGAGKTTSMKMIMGLVRPTSGEICWHEKMGRSRREILSSIGFMPERPYFYPHISGKQFLTYLGKLSGLDDVRLKKQMKIWTERLRIDFALDRLIKTYSKGMLQRIGFAATVIHDPQLIILDEPLSGLDPVGRKEIKDALIDLSQMGKSIFFSSHIVSDVQEICQKVIFLEKGKVVYQGTIETILSSQQSDYTLKLSNKLTHDLSPQAELIHSGAEGLFFYRVKAELKDQLISELITRGQTIEGLERQRPSLEEAFYHIKQAK